MSRGEYGFGQNRVLDEGGVHKWPRSALSTHLDPLPPIGINRFKPFWHRRYRSPTR